VQGQDRLPQTIGGYRIVRRLSREATVDVLLAKSEAARGQERSVVLTLVSPTFRGDASFEQTFVRETQALAQLDHPSVIRLLDVFSAPDIRAMVFEDFEGVTLSELRSALIARSEMLPEAAVYAIAAALFSALAAAHAARDPNSGNLLPIVHRDVNPSQIIIARDGAVKLGGFGLERITGVRGDARNPEARGYLPPEKARGEAVTIRSDVYAAMIIVWELLARRRAVRDDVLPEQELARALAQPTLVSLEVLRPDLPALVRSVVSRALEPQVERRAVTAEEAASIFWSAAPPEDATRSLAEYVSRSQSAIAAAPMTPEPARAREPLPSFPPRPSPRRMWNSSPTLTPLSTVSPPSSRSGSIPDARFSQDVDRVSSMPTSPGQASKPSPIPPPPGIFQPQPPLAPPPPSNRPPSSRGFATRTQAGGFDVGALQPLLAQAALAPPPVAPAPTAAAPPPSPYTPPTPTPGPAAFAPAGDARTPAASLPGMGVPLAMAPLPPTPPVPDVVAPAPAPQPLWSPPAAPVPLGLSAATAPTVRPPRPAKRSSSMMALTTGLFLVTAAIGAAGFVWLFRKPVVQTAHTVQTAKPTKGTIATATATPSSTATATATATSTATATATPTATAKVTAAPTAAPEASAAAGDGTTGTLRIDKRFAGHRIFFDGKVLGEGESFTVPCGKHTVKVGSRGKPQKLDIPCGGEASAK